MSQLDAVFKAGVLSLLVAILGVGVLVLVRGEQPRGDGIEVLLPVVEPTPRTILVSPAEGPGGVAADGRVNINLASRAELESLPEIGPKLAGAILEHRRTHGAFLRVEDLLLVPGIGEATLQRLRGKISVT